MNWLRHGRGGEGEEVGDLVPAAEEPPVPLGSATINDGHEMFRAFRCRRAPANQRRERVVVKQHRKTRKHGLTGIDVPAHNLLQLGVAMKLLESQIEPGAEELLNFVNRLDASSLTRPALHPFAAGANDRINNIGSLGNAEASGDLDHAMIPSERFHLMYC